ncbi:MAG: hypothetical protein LBG81_04595 [Coriobacteriaceae bacterium]|nr:hypothetical protein [Coriobacteriaceae bacterium]
MPAVLLPKAKQKPYLPPSLESPRLVCVEVPQFKAKPFLGFKAKVAALPRVPPLVVPDAYEKLKDLLPQAKGSKPVEASDQKDAASRNAKP